MRPAAPLALLVLSLLLGGLAPHRSAAQDPPEPGIPTPPGPTREVPAPSAPVETPLRGVIASGHVLATRVGIGILRAGGNAFDAGLGTAMALKALRAGGTHWGGSAALVLYSARDGETMTRTGVGIAPAGFASGSGAPAGFASGGGAPPAGTTSERLPAAGQDPAAAALVPADVDVWLAVLARYGTLDFAGVSRGALEIAGADPAGPGRLIRYLTEAEQRARAAGASRIEAIRAARDAFYRGEPAQAADVFYRSQPGGVLRYKDLAGYAGKWLPPRESTYRGCRVRVPEGWSQGPVLVLMLNMLEGYDLKALGFNSAAYIHLLSQVIDLAMSDGRRYVGDPDFSLPSLALYSQEYAHERSGLIRADLAFQDMPPWGDPARMKGVAEGSPTRFAAAPGPDETPSAGTPGADILGVGAVPRSAGTCGSSLCAMDAEGNLLAMTLDGWEGEAGAGAGDVSAAIPGWGFGLVGGLHAFDPEPLAANSPAPGKRPRVAGVPVLVLRDGQPFLAMSAPGGERSAQAVLQVLVNIVDWGMSPEEALDQPRFGSENFVTAGASFNLHPAGLVVEDRVAPEVVQELEAMGHRVQTWRAWSEKAGVPTAVSRGPAGGPPAASVDVREAACTSEY